MLGICGLKTCTELSFELFFYSIFLYKSVLIVYLSIFDQVNFDDILDELYKMNDSDRCCGPLHIGPKRHLKNWTGSQSLIFTMIVLLSSSAIGLKSVS